MRLFDLWALLQEDPPTNLRWDVATGTIYIGRSNEMRARVTEAGAFVQLAHRIHMPGRSGWIPYCTTTTERPDLIVRLIHNFFTAQEGPGHDRILH